MGLLLIAGALCGQSEPSGGTGPPYWNTPFEETVQVHEVRLTVRVDNWIGLPVGGLTVDDFSVSEDGEPVEIVDFRLLGRAGRDRAGRSPPGSSADASADPGVAATPSEDASDQELVVLLIDVETFLPRFARVVQHTLDWIDAHPREVAERTWVVGVLDGPAAVVGEPTRDPEQLRSIIAQLKERTIRDPLWRFTFSPADSAWIRNSRAYDDLASRGAAPLDDGTARDFEARLDCLDTRGSLQSKIRALRKLVESLGPVRGRKTVVWMHGTGESGSCATGDIWDLVDAIREIGSLAAASGVVVHTSSQSGLNAPDPPPPTAQTMHLVTPTSFRLSVASNMAFHTGGQRLALNDPTLIFRRAFDDPVYEITVLVPHGRYGREHHVDVDLRGHPLALLRYQRTYVDLSARQLLLNQLHRLSLLPGSYGAFPVHLQGTGSQEGDEIIARVTVAVPAQRVGLLEREDHLVAELEPYVAVHTLDGELVEVKQLADAAVRLPGNAEIGPADAFTAEASLRLPPGEYLVTGAFYDRLNETSGVTSARLDLRQEAAH